MRQGVKYTAVLIGIYLFVYYGGGPKVIKEGSTGATNFVRALQGR